MSIPLADPVNDRDHARGPSDAPVTLLEYGDYECQYSGHAYYIIQQLERDLAGQIRFVFRNFPLTQIRPHALPAALAAEAADKQGRFWEMHNILYEQQDSLEPEYLIAFAQVLGLDIEQFIDDMTSDEVGARVREDFVGGIGSGVNLTPTFFINGDRHDGAYDYDTLRKAIEDEIKRQESRQDKGAAAREHSRSRS